MTDVRPRSGVAIAHAVPATRALVALLAATMVTAVIVNDMQGSALSPLIATMMHDLSLNAADVGWILNGYTLAGAAFSGFLARAGDSFGQRRMLLIISGIGLVGAVLAGFAWSFPVLLIGRVMMGMGLAAVALVWGLIRPRASAAQVQRFSFLNATTSFAVVAVASLLGGLFIVSGIPWQAIFWVTAAGYVLLIGLVIATPEAQVSRDAVRFDLVGGIGLGLWLFALLLGMSWGIDDGYGDPRTVTVLIVAAVLCVLWVVQQVRNPHRLMAFHRDDARLMLSGYTGAWSIYLTSAFMFSLMPIMLQAPQSSGYGLGLGVLESTLPLLMLLPAAAVTWVTSGLLLRAFGPRVVMFGGAVVTTCAFVGLAWFNDSYGEFFVWVFVYGLGLLTVYHCSMALTAASTRQDNVAVTVGMQYAAGSLVASVSTAIVINVIGTGDENGVIPLPNISFGFLLGGLLILALGVVWLFLVPRRHVDRHAVDAPAE
ncbi:MFS transporter [Microbacterium sp. X-17]|uniref:MFS transporter n=1 Tax=Microbacterium sp. X-17 TaxID=3144404 RepID=UPI0031F4881E